MSFLTYINEILRPNNDNQQIGVLDLFAGYGGLSLGFEAAGFSTIGFEMNKATSDIYN